MQATPTWQRRQLLGPQAIHPRKVLYRETSIHPAFRLVCVMQDVLAAAHLHIAIPVDWLDLLRRPRQQHHWNLARYAFRLVCVQIIGSIL